MASRLYEPPPRWCHYSGAIGGQLYVYGGYTDDWETEKGYVHSFNQRKERWRTRLTRGKHHPGGYMGASTTTAKHFYLYGGSTQLDSLHQLDTESMEWKQLPHSPMSMTGSRMVSYKQKLMVVGGYGTPSGPTQPGEFAEDQRFANGAGWTNKLHVFDVKEERWYTPTVTGTKPPPCSHFSLTAVGDHHAVLFGGHGANGRSNQSYLLDLSKLHWSVLGNNEGPLPIKRTDHTAVWLWNGGNYPQLLMLGGQDEHNNVLSDAWILDIQSGRWREVNVPGLQGRFYHSAAAFSLRPGLMEVTLFGGCPLWPKRYQSDDDVQRIAKTTILRFEYQERLSSAGGPSIGEWTFVGIYDTRQLGTEQRVKEKEEMLDIEGIVGAIEKQESIDRKHAQAMFIGPGGSGKSSLMDRMVNKKRLVYISTGVVDPVVIVDIDVNPSTFCAVAVVDPDRWEEVEFDTSLVGHLHESAYSVQQQLVQDTMPALSPNHPSQSTASPTPESVPVSTTTADADRAVVMATNPVTSTLSTTTPPVNDSVRQAISTAVTKHGGFAKFDYLLKKKFSLYLRDAGGQVEFQEMVSLLVFGPSIFFFVFRADQNLKGTFPVGFRKSASESINRYISSVTIEEALLQCLASVSAMDMPGEATGLQTHSPYVFIVATHKDKLGASADMKLHQLNEDLKSLIKESGFDDLVQYADQAKGEIMFAVDNTSASDEDFRVIRSKVHHLINNRKEFTVEYPLSYLLFCLELQSDHRSVLTLEECRAMAAKYNIVGDKVFHLLYFLHLKIGVCHFINIEGVKRILMKRPEDLFNKVTDLVVGTFSCGTLTMKEAADLRKGILTASTFESVITSKDVITADEFLKILVHLRIVAEFTKPGENEKRYFIPCVLNHVSELTDKDLETDIALLAVKFKCKHCPKGLFGVLVTHLIAPEAEEREGSDISFTLKDNKISKDQVSFDVESSDRQDEMSLKLHPLHLEINLYPEQSEDCEVSAATVCNEVRERINRSILNSLEDLHYNRANVEPVMCIKCPNCSQLHPVKEGKKRTIHCDKTRKTTSISPQAGYWWNAGGQPQPLGTNGQPSGTAADYQTHNGSYQTTYQPTGSGYNGRYQHPYQPTGSPQPGRYQLPYQPAGPPQAGHYQPTGPPQAGHYQTTGYPQAAGHYQPAYQLAVPPQAGHYQPPYQFTGPPQPGNNRSYPPTGPPQPGHNGGHQLTGPGHNGGYQPTGFPQSYQPTAFPQSYQPTHAPPPSYAPPPYVPPQPGHSGGSSGGLSHPLTMDDHYTITTYLKGLLIEDLIKLGVALGLYYPSLNKMHPLLEEMVASWLIKEDNVCRASGNPTWASLIKALQDINQPGTAADIVKKVTFHPLTVVDHCTITNYLEELLTDDLMKLGGALGLYYPRLNKMNHLLHDMVASWLNRDDNVQSASGDPSWDSLIKALRDIDQPGIADNIVKKQRLVN